MKKKLLLLLLGLIVCLHVVADSPYIDKVYDYSPAPGQFINTMPQYESGDTHAVMTQKANDALAANKRSMICLGGFGGSVTFGFDHDIPNVQGEYDFQILGNAVNSITSAEGRVGGSAEPGVILVAADANGNGLPDDEWYEIAGSEYNNPLTIHDYTITYYRTSANHVPTPSETNNTLTDTTYIEWKDSEGRHGYIARNTYHQQDYYPQWVEDDSVSFSGTLLPDNYEWVAENKMYVLYCYDYGYADNYANNSELSKINIDWAVDSNGNPADLQAVRFVKIYTGVNQQCGWIGETSTEIMGAVDLHFTNDIGVVEYTGWSDLTGVYDITGRYIASNMADNLKSGMYIVKYANRTIKRIICP